MPNRQFASVYRQVGQLFRSGTNTGLSEGQLLDRFVSNRDDSAFEAIVARHGPMVMGVCRGLLRDSNDVDDAFQATFLVLVKKAGSLRQRDLLGNWLYGVAHRVATRARHQSHRRSQMESIADEPMAAVDEASMLIDIRPLIHDELNRLPATYRAAVVLCLLQGQTHEAAAQQLGWPLGTVKGRLARAKDLLRSRLVRRGLTVAPAALLTALAREGHAAVTPSIAHHTTTAALSLLTATSISALTISPQVLSLTGVAMSTLTSSTLKLAATSCVAGMIAISAASGYQKAEPASPPATPSTLSKPVVSKTHAALSEIDRYDASLSQANSTLNRFYRHGLYVAKSDLVEAEENVKKAIEDKAAFLRKIPGADLKTIETERNQKLADLRQTVTSAKALIEAARAQTASAIEQAKKAATTPLNAEPNAPSKTKALPAPAALIEGKVEVTETQENLLDQQIKLARQVLQNRSTLSEPDRNEWIKRLDGLLIAQEAIIRKAEGIDYPVKSAERSLLAAKQNEASVKAQFAADPAQARETLGRFALEDARFNTLNMELALLKAREERQNTTRQEVAPGVATKKLISTTSGPSSEIKLPSKPPIPPADLERNKKIEIALEKIVPLHLATETPLADFLKFIKSSTEVKGWTIPIYVSPQGLDHAEKTMTSPIMIELDGVPLRTTLRLALRQLDLDYKIEDGILIIDAITRLNPALNEPQPGGFSGGGFGGAGGGFR
jgi:RNA polymerase sigma factor (sigma-70 family)